MSDTDSTPDDTETEMDDYAAESDWGLDDTKAAEEPVERYVRIGGRERRLLVIEATNADADAIQRKLRRRGEDEALSTIAEFLSEHIVEPDSFADTSAEDVEAMRIGVAEKLVDAIAPDSEGNLTP